MESEVNTKVYTYESLKEKFGHYSNKIKGERRKGI